jgi:aspartokinase-like uncharacterized kinase
MRVADIVVKIGGGLLADAAWLDRTLAIVQSAAARQRLLVVPGGGPFADAVRQVDRRLALTEHAAHWMAILAMDQHAHLLIERLSGAALVTQPAEIAAAVGSKPSGAAVLAPYRWLRDADPLPHSWTVTSDSIAAWVAGQTGAARLVLVKPPGAATGNRVDPYFPHALPAGVCAVVVAADQTDALASQLQAVSDPA